VCERALPQFGGTGADGAFRPTTSATLDTTNRPNGWDFTTIEIPQGVIVRLVGTNPAILRSQGPVTVAGQLRADGSTQSAPGAGGYAGGVNGGAGAGPAGGRPGYQDRCTFGNPDPGPEPGGHRGRYGSHRPFDLRGGSGGGSLAEWCRRDFSRYHPGCGGGGTVVVLADGPVVIPTTGVVSASGGAPDILWQGGSGAGGCVLLRSAQTVTVRGELVAVDPRFTLPPGSPPVMPVSNGFIRVDAFGAPPDLAGARINPQAYALELPDLVAPDPVPGRTWTLGVATTPGDQVAFVLGVSSTSIPTPFGVLRLDPTAGLLILGVATAAAGAIESEATLSVRLGVELAALRGLELPLQAIAGPRYRNAPPRLTNFLLVRIQ
jgi:hypothetical protein